MMKKLIMAVAGAVFVFAAKSVEYLDWGAVASEKETKCRLNREILVRRCLVRLVCRKLYRLNDEITFRRYFAIDIGGIIVR